MKMSHYRQTLDYLVDVNIREESYLFELLIDYRKEWPTVADDLAKERLQAILIERIIAGTLAIYAERWANPDSRRELTPQESTAAILDRGNWLEPEHTTWFHHIYEVDNSATTRSISP